MISKTIFLNLNFLIHNKYLLIKKKKNTISKNEKHFTNFFYLHPEFLLQRRLAFLSDSHRFLSKTRWKHDVFLVMESRNTRRVLPQVVDLSRFYRGLETLMDRVVEVARDRLSLERGVSVLCRAFFYLENGCIQRVSDGRLKIMMPRVGGWERSLSVDVVMEELEMWSDTIR